MYTGNRLSHGPKLDPSFFVDRPAALQGGFCLSLILKSFVRDSKASRIRLSVVWADAEHARQVSAPNANIATFCDCYHVPCRISHYDKKQWVVTTYQKVVKSSQQCLPVATQPPYTPILTQMEKTDWIRLLRRDVSITEARKLKQFGLLM